MKIQKITNNTTVFTYDTLENYLTNVFLIEKKHRIYLIDTFCGPDSLKPVLNYIENYNNKELIIINTHFHWDHVWGNCSFKNNKIIAHKKCRKLLNDLWDDQIKESGKYFSGKVKKILPNIIFEEKLIFSDDELELFYTPGHTIDSISVFDHQEKTLFVGDNIENPIVYVENNDLETYIKTLYNYYKYSPKKIFGAHTLQISDNDLNNTIQYLQNLSNNVPCNFLTEHEKNIHKFNLDFINKK